MYPRVFSNLPRALLLTVAIVILAFALLGCRDRKGSDSTADPTPAPQATNTVAAPTRAPNSTATEGPTAPPAATTATMAPPLVDAAQPGPDAVGVLETSVSRPSSTTDDTRVLEIIVWYPASAGGSFNSSYEANDGAPAAAGGPFPVLIFSHGSGGNPAQSIFYTTHLASHGFVVVALSHPGNTTSDCYPCVRPAELLDSGRNRPDDVSAVFDALCVRCNRPLPYRPGHSYGAWTTLISLAEDGRFPHLIP